MKEGLFLPDGGFKSRQEIMRRLFPYPEVNPPPIVEKRSLEDWTNIGEKRKKERDEILKLPTHIEITHSQNQPVFYALIGDVHIGGDVDYERFKNEVLAIKNTPQTYVITVGDLTDNFFFTPAIHDAFFNLQEQAYFSKSVFEELKGRLMVAIAGNHELWSDDKGLSIYHKFVEEYKAHYMEGLAYITINVFNSKFNLAVAHKYGGSSIYNFAHSAHRLYREQGEGADVVITAHTHKKAINQQTVKGFGGARQVLFISLGGYKNTDKYSRKEGFSKKNYEEQGGVGLIFYPEEKRVDAFWDLIEGVEVFRGK